MYFQNSTVSLISDPGNNEKIKYIKTLNINRLFVIIFTQALNYIVYSLCDFWQNHSFGSEIQEESQSQSK